MVAGLFAYDLGPVWTAWNQLAVENERVADYHGVADYWASYAARLQGRRDALAQNGTDMEVNTAWSTDNQAAKAFYDRLQQGVTSMDPWLNGVPQQISRQLRTVADSLGTEFQTVNGHKQWLLQQSTQDPGSAQLRPITPQDTQVMVPEGTDLDQMDAAVRESVDAAQRVIHGFEGVTRLFDQLPKDAQWGGPAVVDVNPPGQDPNQPGGPQTMPGAGPGGSPGGSPGGVPAAPGGGAPTGDSAGADPSAATDAMSPTDSSSATDSSNTPSAPDPSLGGSPSTLDSSPPLPDPSLSGTPTSTLDPITTSPGTTPSNLSTVPSPSLGSGLGPSTTSTSSPLTPFVPTGLSPGSSSRSPVGGTSPSSTGIGGGAESDTRIGAAEVEAGPGLARSGSGPSGGASGGIYPPMMPPMMPGGGQGGGGVKPGDARSSGGPSMRSSGRDSWRAGLRPQLQGRSGGEDERRRGPVFPPSGGDVLDEELWQVADTAPPPAPPQQEPRRGRSRGA